MDAVTNNIPQTTSDGDRLFTLRRWWTYTDANGEPVLHVARYECDNGRKTIRPFRPGAVRSGLQGLRPPIFNLPAILASSWVIIVEGEKVAEALRTLGLPATTIAGGSDGLNRADLDGLRHLQQVVVCPDNDGPGHKYARSLILALEAINPEAQAKVAEINTGESGSDLADFIQGMVPDWNGLGSLEQHPRRDEIRESVVAAIKAKAVPASDWLIGGWPDIDPADLVPAPAPAVAFPVDALGSPMARWVSEQSRRLNVSPDFLGCALLSLVSVVVAGRMRVIPKLQDLSWRVVPLVTSLLVGPSSSRKSPAASLVRELADPINAVERAAWQTRFANWSARDAARRAERRALEERLRKLFAGKTGGTLDEAATVADLQRRLQEVEAEALADPRPFEPELIVDATSPEKLIELAAARPAGVLVYFDEAADLFRDRAAERDLRTLLLTGTSGGTAKADQKIARGRTYTPQLNLALLALAQPRLLEKRLADSEGLDIGLLQRFQLPAWPEPAEYAFVDEPMPAGVCEALDAMLMGLHTLDLAETIGDSIMVGDVAVALLRFSPEAVEAFETWDRNKTRRLRELEAAGRDELAAWVEKAARTLIAIAGLLHLIDHLGREAIPPVSLSALRRAEQIVAYAEGQAARLYSLALPPDLRKALALLALLQAGELEQGFKARDAYKRHRTDLKTPEDVEIAAKALGEEIIRREVPAYGGVGRPPAPRFYFNPAIQRRQT